MQHLRAGDVRRPSAPYIEVRACVPQVAHVNGDVTRETRSDNESREQIIPDIAKPASNNCKQSSNM